MNLRALLRHTGPLPVSQMSSRMNDEFLEKVAALEGGLVQFLRDNTRYFHVVSLPGGIHVAMASEVTFKFKSRHQVSGALLIALLTAAAFFPGKTGLSSTQPTIKELTQAHNVIRSISLDAVMEIVTVYRIFFTPDPSRQRVRLTTPPVVTAPSAVQQVSASQARLHAFLHTYLPSQFHVPFSYLQQLPDASDVFPKGTPTVVDIQQLVSSLPNDVAVDLRVFGPSPAHVFLRLLHPTPLLASCSSAATGHATAAVHVTPEEAAAAYSPVRLAHKVTYHLQTLLAKNRLHYLSLSKNGLRVDQLDQLLPADVLEEIRRLYGIYGASTATAERRDSTVAADGPDPTVAVLLFDRFRHVYDVNLAEYVVRPWSLLPRGEQPSSLTEETSPLPRVLRHCQDILNIHGSLPPLQLFEALPKVAQTQLLEVFRSSSPNDMQTGPTVATDEGTVKQVMMDYAVTHSLYIFHRGGLMYTPQTAAREAGRRPTEQRPTSESAQKNELGRLGGEVRSQSDRDIEKEILISEAARAKYLGDTLKPGELVDAYPFLRFHSNKGMRDYAYRKDFFFRYPQHFRAYQLFFNSNIIVGRVDTAPPPAHVLAPRINTLEALIKLMALVSIGGALETTILNATTDEGRATLKRFGTYTDVAEQLPMWFDVKRNIRQPAASIITYIGTAMPAAQSENGTVAPAKAQQRLEKRRVLKVVNDPFAALPHVEDDEVWNPDWDEEESDAAPL